MGVEGVSHHFPHDQSLSQSPGIIIIIIICSTELLLLANSKAWEQAWPFLSSQTNVLVRRSCAQRTNRNIYDVGPDYCAARKCVCGFFCVIILWITLTIIHLLWFIYVDIYICFEVIIYISFTCTIRDSNPDLKNIRAPSLYKPGQDSVNEMFTAHDIVECVWYGLISGLLPDTLGTV